MWRIILSVVLACLFVWFGFLGVWTQAERFPDSMAWVLLAPFAPGLGMAALANRLGMNDPDFGKYWLILYGVNLVVWTAVFYGLATVYVQRRERRQAES
jgi:hypothetical protein